VSKLFTDFQFPETLLTQITSKGFDQPTEIQSLSMGPVMEGRDVIACAQTGSGKTLAFALPILAKLLQEPEMKALILAPTRELAEQIIAVVQEFSPPGMAFKSALLIGGSSMIPQLRNLKKNPQIIVATPGRLIDHLERKSLNLDRVKYFVLDECDRMLDMGFAPQIQRIRRQLPRQRQTLLFSATLPPEVEKIAREDMSSPLRIGAESKVTIPIQIIQNVMRTTVAEKNEVLLRQLAERQGSAIIFARTKSRTDRLAKFLTQSGLIVERIHGDRSQSQRRNAIDSFRKGKASILVATDVASRGLDLPQIRFVVNYDIPQCAEDFVHRVGRTGRAGADGESLTLLTSEDADSWRSIERFVSGKSTSGGSTYQSRGQGSSSRGGSRGGPRNDQRGQSSSRSNFRDRSPRNEFRNEARSEPRSDSRGESRGSFSARPSSRFAPKFKKKAPRSDSFASSPSARRDAR